MSQYGYSHKSREHILWSRKSNARFTKKVQLLLLGCLSRIGFFKRPNAPNHFLPFPHLFVDYIMAVVDCEFFSKLLILFDKSSPNWNWFEESRAETGRGRRARDAGKRARMEDGVKIKSGPLVQFVKYSLSGGVATIVHIIIFHLASRTARKWLRGGNIRVICCSSRCHHSLTQFHVV